jgi:sporulation protein YlmC with PRC-barrel domain
VETADTIPPEIVKGAFLTLGDGRLIIQASETILNTTVSFNGMRVTNNTGEGSISLDGASLVPSIGSTVNFTVQLTELQRVSVIAISGTPGGDGSSTTLDIDPNQVTDVALNPNIAGASVVIHEDPDVIIPTFVSAAINLSTGVLKVLFSETIDMTPISLVNTSKFSISNFSDSQFVNLVGSIASGGDLPTVTITLTEPQRVSAIEMSSQPGGDGIAQFVSATFGAVQDISTNSLEPATMLR